MAALRVSGQNMDVGESLRSTVETRVANALSKYFDGAYHGHVTVARDGGGFRTECVLHLGSGITLEASGLAHDAYASFDQSAERIEKRLRRYKRRLKERPGGHGSAGAGDGSPEASAAFGVIAPPEDGWSDETYSPVVVAETTRAVPRLSLAHAVAEFDLTGAPVLLFTHAVSGRVNVLYRRHDGGIGWIDAPVPSA